MSKINGYDTKRVLLGSVFAIIFFFLVFGWVGIAAAFIIIIMLLMQKKKQRHNQADIDRKNVSLLKKLFLILLPLLLIVAVLYVIGSNPAASGVPKNSASAGVGELQPKSSDTTNATLDDLFYRFASKSSDLTDLQKQNAWKEYRGKYISGSASVEDVKYESLVGYVVSIESPENQFGREATIYFRDSEKDKLMNIQKGDMIGFYGSLIGYSDILGIVIKNAEVRAT